MIISPEWVVINDLFECPPYAGGSACGERSSSVEGGGKVLGNDRNYR